MSNTWWKDVVTRLKEKQLQHRNYVITRARLSSGMFVRMGGEAICLTGPSRGGKTSIIREVVRLNNPPSFEDRLERLPVALFNARNKSDKGKFTTRAFYINALKAINHPFYCVTDSDLNLQVQQIKRTYKDSNDELADILESALRILGVKYLIIDEAQHLRYIVGGDEAACHVLESLKTMAEALGCVIIFVGAYPILEVLGLAPHMLGREYPIEFPRYRADSESDIRAFMEILKSFSGGIRFEKGVTSLSAWDEYLFEGSLGVTGLLCAWIRNSLSEMAARGDSALGIDHIRFALKPTNDRSRLLSEIQAGEKYLSCWDNIEDLLKAPPETNSEKAPAPKPPPFQAKPKRRTPEDRV